MRPHASMQSAASAARCSAVRLTIASVTSSSGLRVLELARPVVAVLPIRGRSLGRLCLELRNRTRIDAHRARHELERPAVLLRERDRPRAATAPARRGNLRRASSRLRTRSSLRGQAAPFLPRRDGGRRLGLVTTGLVRERRARSPVELGRRATAVATNRDARGAHAARAFLRFGGGVSSSSSSSSSCAAASTIEARRAGLACL